MLRREKKGMKKKKMEVIKEFQVEELEKRVELSCGVTIPGMQKILGK